MLSLRARVIFGCTVVVALVGSGSAFGIVSIASELNQVRFRDDFVTYVMQFGHALLSGEDLSTYGDQWNLADQPSVWVLDGQKELLAKNGPLSDGGVRLPSSGFDYDRHGPQLVWGSLEDGTAALFLCARRPDEEMEASEQRLMIAVRPAIGLSEQQRDISLLMALAIILTCVLVAIGMWLLTRVLLKPVDLLAEAMQVDLSELNPAQLVVPERTPLELRILWQRLHEMAERIVEAVARERRVSAEIAHELRSPLAGVRAHLDLALSRDRDSQDMHRALLASSRLVGDLQGLTEKLMLLTRIEYGQVPLRLESLRVDDLIDEASDRLGPDNPRRWQLGGEVAAKIECDTELMALVCANLIENATTYGSDPQAICITVRNDADALCLFLVNPLREMIEAQELDRLCDPFYRIDRSRHEAARHGGLGLALCRRIVDLHGGKMMVRCEHGKDGPEFIVELRLSGDAKKKGKQVSTE